MKINKTMAVEKLDSVAINYAMSESEKAKQHGLSERLVEWVFENKTEMDIFTFDIKIDSILEDLISDELSMGQRV